VNSSEIQKLAHLARLEISSDTVEETAKSINEVLALVDQLKAAKTDGVAPMAHPLDAIQKLRVDEVEINFLTSHPPVRMGFSWFPKSSIKAAFTGITITLPQQLLPTHNSRRFRLPTHNSRRFRLTVSHETRLCKT